MKNFFTSAILGFYALSLSNSLWALDCDVRAQSVIARFAHKRAQVQELVVQSVQKRLQEEPLALESSGLVFSLYSDLMDALMSGNSSAAVIIRKSLSQIIDSPEEYHFVERLAHQTLEDLFLEREANLRLAAAEWFYRQSLNPIDRARENFRQEDYAENIAKYIRKQLGAFIESPETYVDAKRQDEVGAILANPNNLFDRLFPQLYQYYTNDDSELTKRGVIFVQELLSQFSAYQSADMGFQIADETDRLLILAEWIIKLRGGDCEILPAGTLGPQHRNSILLVHRMGKGFQGHSIDGLITRLKSDRIQLFLDPVPLVNTSSSGITEAYFRDPTHSRFGYIVADPRFIFQGGSRADESAGHELVHYRLYKRRESVFNIDFVPRSGRDRFYSKYLSASELVTFLYDERKQTRDALKKFKIGAPDINEAFGLAANKKSDLVELARRVEDYADEVIRTPMSHFKLLSYDHTRIQIGFNAKNDSDILDSFFINLRDLKNGFENPKVKSVIDIFTALRTELASVIENPEQYTAIGLRNRVDALVYPQKVAHLALLNRIVEAESEIFLGIESAMRNALPAIKLKMNRLKRLARLVRERSTSMSIDPVNGFDSLDQMQELSDTLMQFDAVSQAALRNGAQGDVRGPTRSWFRRMLGI
jgi:hypothetical protein